MTDLPYPVSAQARRTAPQPISYLMSAALANPELISLAAGFVDDTSLPVEISRDIFSEILANPARGRPALQYGTTQGLPALRTAIYDHLQALAATDAPLPYTPDDIVVTTGSQQLLALLTDVLIDPRDIVITAAPSYFVYAGTLQSAGADIRTVEMDAGGIIVESLAACLENLAENNELERLRIVYIQPYFQNPTGLTLAADRKQPIFDLIEAASRRVGHRILLIEDAAYRELAFTGQTSPTFKSLDTQKTTVALLQTFSKSFAPGLRTGFGVLPSALLSPVIQQKGNQDFGSSNLAQHFLHQALTSGAYQNHLTQLRIVYARKAQLMLDALDAHLRQTPVTWTIPGGGLYTWLTLPAHIDTGPDSALFQAALDAGVLYVPGIYCYNPDPNRIPPTHTLRLTFGSTPQPLIPTGIQRLSQAIQQFL